jgi:hypothetical protein
MATRYSRYFYKDVAQIIARAKHYTYADVRVSGVVGGASQDITSEGLRLTIATHFADLFEADNSRFDRVRFLKQCNGE